MEKNSTFLTKLYKLNEQRQGETRTTIRAIFTFFALKKHWKTLAEYRIHALYGKDMSWKNFLGFGWVITVLKLFGRLLLMIVKLSGRAIDKLSYSNYIAFHNI